MSILDHAGRSMGIEGSQAALEAELKIAIDKVCRGKPAGAIAIACTEYVIHVAQQSNSPRAFREAVSALFDQAAGLMREHL